MLSLRNISKSYTMGATVQTVLSALNLDIQANSMNAIMGASGSGKSTLMNIIGLLDTPDTGEYSLNGQKVASLDDDERADIRNLTIGFVFQQFFLLPRLTAAENVALPLTYRNEAKSVIRERVNTLLDRVGMRDRAHHRPNELSGGQQQRVAIARALVGDPNVILADEPTGALDSHTGEAIMQLFHELHQQESRTLIIVTHDQGIGEQCQRKITLSDGKIISDTGGSNAI